MPEPVTTGSLCRDFLAAWRDRERVLEKQREADAAMHAANEKVGLSVKALEPLLAGDGPASKSFSCEGWVVTLVRAAKGQPITAVAVPTSNAEPV